MAKITLSNGEFYYEQHGQGTDLVLIAGLSAACNVWYEMLPFLTEHFRVLIYDNRDIGYTYTNGAAYSTQDMASDLNELLSALDIAKAHVLGHSMGGAIAQQFALHHAEHLSRLILLSCRHRKFSKAAQMRFALAEEMIKLKLPARLIVEANVPWLYASRYLEGVGNTEKAIDFLLKKPRVPTLAERQRQYQAAIQHQTTDVLNQIQAPTLVITGDQDILTLPHNSEFMAEQIPNARLEILPECGHVVPMEMPQQLSEVMLSFLNEEN